MLSQAVDPAQYLPPRCDPASLALLDCLAQAVWIYDPERRCIAWANRAGLCLWDADSIDELRSREMPVTSAGARRRLENLARESRMDGSIATSSWVLHPRGHPTPIHCRITAVQLEDGRPALLVERSDPPAAGNLMLQVELRALEAMRQSSLMISLASIEGLWLMHNPAAEALMTALDHANIPNMDNFLRLFADPAAADALRSRAMADNTAQARLQVAGVPYRMHEVSLRRVLDPVTDRMSLLVTQQDVTRAFKLEQRLERALAHEREVNETQRRFLAMTSHEFRTPLAVIDVAARRISRLAAEPGTADAVRERTGTIRAAVRRLALAVDHALSATRIAEGNIAFQPIRTDIAAALGNAVAAMQTLHPDRRIDCSLPDLPALDLDLDLAVQVFENLLANAIKYSPPDTPVEVEARLADKAVEIAISDRGIGVPAEEIPLLFRRFFRSSRSLGVKGTGIGLHTVRYFMRLHGGTVDLASPGKAGTGTTVTVAFPLPGQHGAAAPTG